MSEYLAPLKDMQFTLELVRQHTGLDQIEVLAEMTPDFANTILAEAAKFATGVLSPLNQVGDQQGCRFDNGTVITPPGWQQAYQQFCDNGWMGLAMTEAAGGQALPRFIAQPVNEMWLSANLAFVMFHALNQGGSDILRHFGSATQQQRYLEPLASGQWTIAMALTEPGAGSDLAATTTKATPLADGNYRIKGQKIFITYGEHDMAANIIHLVLARTPDAPAGSRGISLFAVPKYRIEADGSLGAHNDVVCSGIEHKMGLHGSPTCSISYGDHDDCIGELIGAENQGLMAMFVLMNEARLSTGMQGVGFGELSYQHALRYAQERSQGSHFQNGTRVTINQHPDVQRMLLTMRSQTMGLRALGYLLAAWIDLAEHSSDEQQRQQLRGQIALLTPVFKAFGTEQGNQMSYTCLQVFGGMGFVEETGIAQFMRDARIITIYEGTTGIQARDLLFRKILADKGTALRCLLRHIHQDADRLATPLAELQSNLIHSVAAMQNQLEALLDSANKTSEQTRLHAGSVPLLDALGILCVGWQLALLADQACIRGDSDADYHRNLIAQARFYFAHEMPRIQALLATVADADNGLKDFDFNAAG
ncbi:MULTISPECIES: acyl-CoA dehydrogenase [unclassified Oceanobacter]|uniref:acyl-CoA dehydrogenase n=1 Tax=unclassified Oceanobacter TaxID=2620260 RepID=UPI0026E2734D|nr:MULTISPECIES: acyl-CoA dehydrogenase [unclassified Oceanobacter]MDO6682653.1 acyl-CoA dehydrogenase [Oceanobacter sp. 5_MG-2023]MDP2609138.1 acyl-CoA dehydrogenase [Oceanobacter sp. 1_MG-2023]MDP2612460.1 acyl-CoA dehydrogenase [Oceanobacter sp. 2_MG-2023]